MDLLDRITSATTVATPPGMVAVTKDQFFGFLKRDSRDIMPKLTSREYSDWETPQRLVCGRTYPGWANPGDENAYFITQAAAAALK